MPLNLKNCLPKPDSIEYEKSDGTTGELIVDPNITDEAVKLIDNFTIEKARDNVDWQEIIDIIRAVLLSSKENDPEDVEYLLKKTGAYEKNRIVIFMCHFIKGTMDGNAHIDSKKN